LGYDLLIKNGRVFDGTGGPWFRGDIAITGERIAKIGRINPARADDIIDAGGLAVSPGFVDIHSHSGFSLVKNPEADSFVRQGITTVMNGNCGFSPAPIGEEAKEAFREMLGLEVDWLSFAEYLGRLEGQGVAINAGSYTGLANLRVSAMMEGAWDRAPTPGEMEVMKGMLARSMEEGSFGLSSGLEYQPMILVETKELIELCRVAARYGGIYSVHARSRDVKVVEAAAEAVEIGEKAGIQVEGAHWGARFPSDGKTKHIVDIAEEARERGVDFAFDQVPWTMDWAGVGWCGCGLIEPIIIGSKYTDKGGRFTFEMLRDPEVVEFLRRDLPNRQYGPILAGKRGLLDSWDRMMVAHCEESPQFNGMNLRQIGEATGRDPFDALIDILVAEGEGFERAWGAVGITSLWDTNFSLLHPHCSVAIDSANDSPNPPLGDSPVGEATTRAYGQYPYFFEKWVREDRALTMEEAVRKCTGLPAQRMRLMDRGLLRPGMYADVVVFDPKTIRNTATWEEPRRYPEGIDKVIVNGCVVVDCNSHTGALKGKALCLNDPTEKNQ
jgi:N-acyl-D-amino-acid deacylase